MTFEDLAGELYDAYCEAVGGKAFNGNELPDWQTFRNDPTKQKQSDACGSGLAGEAVTIMKLRFDPAKHDNLIAAVTTEEAKAKAMKVFAEIYTGWKKKFKRKEGMTTEQVKDALLDLRNEVTKRLHAAGCKDWVRFSLEMIDQKLGLVDTAMIKGLNKITQYVPTVQHANIPAEQAEFKSQADMQEIPWVKAVMDKQGFLGFVLVGPILHGFFEDGEISPIGVCASGLGLEKIPSMKDLEKALAANAAKPPGEPSGTPPNPAP